MNFLHNSHYKITLITMITLITSACSTPPQKQTHQTKSSINLYKNWNKLNLTSSTGSSRHTFLPNSLGFLKTKRINNTTTFLKVDPITQKESPLFTPKTINQITTAFNKYTNSNQKSLPFKNFTYTKDASSIIFRNKSISYTYTFATNKITTPIKPSPKLAAWQPHRTSKQLLTGTPSPDNNHIAYIKDYDIYIKNKNDIETRLTFNGSNDIMNGRTDWIYPEELRQSDAFFWSPDSTKIAYLQFDVKDEYIYPLLHEIDLTKNTPAEHYRFNTLLEKQRYPKPGTPNATVRLFIVDLKTKTSTQIQTNANPDQYIVKPIWRKDNSELLYQRLNRFQNKLELLAANPTTGKSRTILVENDPAYVDLHNNYRPLKDGKSFIWSSERSGWRHLYHYTYSGKIIKQLTKGNYEVASISLLDEKNNTIYFTTNMNKGLESHLCKVNLQGGNFKQLTKQNHTHKTTIDPTGKYFTTTYSALTTPPQTDLYTTDGKFIRNLAKTTLDRDKLKQLNLQLPELISFKAADGITNLNAILYKPANFSPNKKYPLLVSVYGGPAQGVRNRFSIGSQTAQLGYFVLKQDNRGTTNRGKKYLNQTYMKFGQVEIDDQAAGVKQICKRPYIDSSRVGIHGHSYGGYATCMAILRYPNIFHVGVASSSVTDWRGYDSIYTERFMRTPKANPQGYKLGSAMHYAKNLKGKLLIAHGLIDNNVHVGNTYHLVDALQKENKEFDLMIYPENRHGIRGYHGKHLRKTRTNYFLKHLKPNNWQQNLIK